LGSLIIGIGLGFGLSYLEQHEKNNSEVLLAVVSAILLGIYLSDLLHLEPMLVSISMGFCLVNISHSGEDIHHHVKGVGLSIYALFFIMAGAHLNIYHLQSVGLFGLIYITGRTLAVWGSAWITGFLLKEKEFPTHLVGLGLLSHAGAALGLISKIDPNENESTHAIVSAITASIFFFEIIGPILLRHVLIKAREVKVGKILEDGSTSLSLNPFDLMQNFLINLGLKKERHFEVQESIEPLILRKIYAIKEQADFDEVVKYIDTHHFPIYPVVNKDLHYEGMIDLAELKNAMFDHFLSRFVVAKDLIGSRHYLNQNDSFEIAMDKFHHSQLSALPVVNQKDGKLLGIIEQKRLLLAIQDKNTTAAQKATEVADPV
jgi:CBS domain-containing protein